MTSTLDVLDELEALQSGADTVMAEGDRDALFQPVRMPSEESETDQVLRAWRMQQPLGFMDAMREAMEKPARLVPFLSGASEAYDLKRLYDASVALQNGKATPEQRGLIYDFLEHEARPKGFGYLAGSIVAELPAFAGEFITTGGALTAGRKLATEAGEVAVGRALVGAIKKAAIGTGKAGLQLGLMEAGSQAVGAAALGSGGSRVEADAWRRAMPDMKLDENQAGKLDVVFSSTARDFYDALPAAIGSQLIEVASERSGEALGRLVGLDRIKAAQNVVARWFLGKGGTADDLAERVAKKAGWNGVVNEFLEERFAGALRAGTLVGEEEFGDVRGVFPGIDQLAAEAAVFSTVGALGAGASRLGRQKPGAPPGVMERETPLPPVPPQAVTSGVTPVTPSVTPPPAQAEPPQQSTPGQEPIGTLAAPPLAQPGAAPPATQVPESVEAPAVQAAAGATIAPPEGQPTQTVPTIPRMGRDVEGGGTGAPTTPTTAPRASDQVREVFGEGAEEVPEAELEPWRAAYAKRLGEYGVGVTFARRRSGGLLERPAAHRPGRLFFDVGAEDLEGLAAHELTHEVRARSNEEFESLYTAIERIDPEGLAASAAEYESRLGSPLEGDQRREEGLAQHAEVLGSWIGNALKNESKIKAIIEKDPGLFERIWEALRRVVARMMGRPMPEPMQKRWRRVARIIRRGPHSPDAKTARVVGEMAKTFSMLRQSTGQERTDTAAKFAAAYHGSPFDFEKFESAKIGTGSGAQAFGHGLYFAGKREVAEYYKEKLADKLGNENNYTVTVDGVRVPLKWDEVRAKFGDGPVSDALRYLQAQGHIDEIRRRFIERGWYDRAGALDALKDRITVTPYRGRLYEVDLAPAEDEYLLWDKPLSEQSEKVKGAVKALLASTGMPEMGTANEFGKDAATWDGGTFYQHIGEFMAEVNDRSEHPIGESGPDAASRALRSAGIRGIKYLDQSSRNKPLKDIRADVFGALPDDATLEEVDEVVAEGKIRPEIAGFLRELKANDWLGFDYPAQAISTALGSRLADYEPTPELRAAISRLQDGATFNYVIFDEKDVTIRNKYALRRVGPVQSPPLFQLPSNTSLGQRLATFWQDKLDPVERVTGQVGAPLGMDDPIVDLRLMRGRSKERIRDLRRKYLEPIRRTARRAKISHDELKEWIYARHAPEANAYLATINNGQQGLSGMSDADALAIMQRVQADPRAAEFDRIGGLFDQMNRAKLDGMVADGLISQEDADTLNARYKHYASLRTFHEDEVWPMMGIGQGFDLPGRELQRRLGRKSAAEQPIAWSFAQAEVAILRGEKNRAMQAVGELVKARPEPRLWVLHPKQVRPALVAGQVQQVADPTFKDADNVVSWKEDGATVRLQINENYLPIATALKNAGAEQVGSVTRVMQAANRVISGLITRWNPGFYIPNLVRDLSTGGITASIEESVGFGARVVRDVPRVWPSIWRGLRGNPGTSKLDKMFQEFREDGGPIAFLDLDNVETQIKTLGKELTGFDPSTWQRTKELGGAVRDWIAAVNDVIELGSRFSYYVNARENLGRSRAEAALGAKELTTNFETKGNIGSVLNALYIFMNASIQGTERVMRAVIRHPGRAAPFLAGMILHGILNDLLNAFFGGDDETGRPRWDNEPAYVKDKNWEVMLPGGEIAFTLPLPFVYNWFFALGQTGSAYARGALSGTEAGGRLGSAWLDVFNPLGSGPAEQVLAPTALDLPTQLATNKDAFGRPIYPETYGKEPPDSELYKNANPTLRRFARWVNQVTGGDQFEEGAVSVSPETLEQAIFFLGQGLPSEAWRVYNGVDKMLEGEPVELREVPILRRFMRDPDNFAIRGRFDDAIKEVETAEKQVKDAFKRGDTARLEELQREKRAYLSMIQEAKAAKKLLSGDKGLWDQFFGTTSAKERVAIEHKILELEADFLRRLYKAQEIETATEAPSQITAGAR